MRNSIEDERLRSREKGEDRRFFVNCTTASFFLIMCFSISRGSVLYIHFRLSLIQQFCLWPQALLTLRFPPVSLQALVACISHGSDLLALFFFLLVLIFMHLSWLWSSCSLLSLSSHFHASPRTGIPALLFFFLFLILIFVCIVLPYFLGNGTDGSRQLLSNGDVEVVNKNRVSIVKEDI